ncbi:TPA: hypothetical protein QCU24_002960 [Bacillus cereus]|uniref:Uncharacterized protein n=1 Tax=Bacillus phage vB_BtS_BMBtp2 TaxID=2884431 RepID=K4LRQ6_9CAUD|nr:MULTISPECIES: hypothetical protein [Bacillus]YP_007236366.1 hypothetical protein ISGA_8 [Bacillus phage vB_BtS_BMBtp2]AGV99368.1 hypothetical protein proCM3_gp06 [Bacillus phage proCM3]HDR6245222.1 hypothetical protein [Bacillus cereus]AFV15401.1 hypothetical protein ISGA_8 [Bacillus phage vB_BtS_BMBtp2]AJQ58640.1 hypothetical protein SD98_10130 [Bacillus thuringiensis serovar morrisoni]MED3098645.1 hypothetical protein [Bacillus thuringiensis]
MNTLEVTQKLSQLKKQKSEVIANQQLIQKQAKRYENTNPVALKESAKELLYWLDVEQEINREIKKFIKLSKLEEAKYV